MAILKYWDAGDAEWKEVIGTAETPTNSLIIKEAVSGSINGSNTTFFTAAAYVAGTLQVYVNGLAQSQLTTETDPTTGEFELDTAPLTGDDIKVYYHLANTGTGNADTVDNFHASSTPTANTIPVLKSSAKLPFGVLGTVRLDATEVTDIANPISLSAGTWTDLKGNQNFTVASADSLIIISISGNAASGGSNIANNVSRVVIDSAGTPINRMVGGAANVVAAQYANPFTGSNLILLTGLSVGTHTIKTQVRSSGNNNIYCRPTGGYEFFNTTVIELGG